MFNAEDARRLVAEYHSKGEALSKEWLQEHLTKALEEITKAAKKGHTEINYKVELENDKYQIVKKKLLHHELMKLRFKVGIEEINKRETLIKKISVFNISWSG